LLSRNLDKPGGKLVQKKWSVTFDKAGERIPKTLIEGFDGKIKTTLLASEEAKAGDAVVGRVFVWQCNRTRGTAAN
jgi:hypothetical protein